MSFDEAILWEKLGNSRHSPLEGDWLGNVYSPSLSAELRRALCERIGWLGPQGWTILKSLINQYGSKTEMVYAAGLCHQIEAKDWLISELENDQDLRLDVIQALACWGAVITDQLLLSVLRQPSQSMRLAGIELLSFKAHQLNDEKLLAITEDLLEDWREPIPLALIRLLQRRDGASITKRLASMATNSSQNIANAAIQALGCIQTQESQSALGSLANTLPEGQSKNLVNKQLKQQYKQYL